MQARDASFLFSVLTLALVACATPPAPAAMIPDSAIAADAIYRYEVEELAPGVHALHQGNVFHIQPRGNVEVIEQVSGVVLVDSGGSPAGAEEVIAFVRAHTRKPVNAIIITHWHGDHALGVSRLLQEWPQARVISTASTRDMLANPAADRFMPGDNAEANAAYMQNIQGGVDFLRAAAADESLRAADRAGFAQATREYEQFGREMARARRMPSTEVFEHRLVLTDRTHPVEVMFLGRANTSGDAIVWLPNQRVVITGDVVVAPIPYGFNAYPEEWIAVLEQIHNLDFAVLAPGHGVPMRDRAYLDRLISMLRDVRAQVAPLAVTDLNAEAVSERVQLDAARETFAGGDPWLRRWFRDYWKDPIVSSALREARGEPITQGAN